MDFPIVLYNKKQRVPPLVVHSQEQLDKTDLSEWETVPPQKEPPALEYPVLVYNVNAPPVTVGSAEEHDALNSEWHTLALSDAVIKAAQANAKAAASAK